MSHAKDLLTIQRALWDDGDRAEADRAGERLAASSERCREALRQVLIDHDCGAAVLTVATERDVRQALGDDAVREAG